MPSTIACRSIAMVSARRTRTSSNGGSPLVPADEDEGAVRVV
jgi:DNA-directed RNA polymerase subunit K/omega